MRRLDVQIPTPDGHSNGTLHLPDGDGPWPGVLVFPDAPAHHGFAVPDNPTYDREADTRHWEALHELYQAHLAGS